MCVIFKHSGVVGRYTMKPKFLDTSAPWSKHFEFDIIILKSIGLNERRFRALQICGQTRICCTKIIANKLSIRRACRSYCLLHNKTTIQQQMYWALIFASPFLSQYINEWTRV